MYSTSASSLSLFALLFTLGTSVPLERRYSGNSNAVKTPSGQCNGAPSPIDNTAASAYAVILDQNDPGICGGFLDNLHGQCGLGITSWTCNASPQGQMNASFVVPTTCQGSSIQNAIYLASEPHANGIVCGWGTPDSPGAGEGLGAMFEALFDEGIDSLGAAFGG